MSEEHNGTAQRLSRTLGWVSLVLGLAQIAAPRAVSRVSGVEDSAAARAVVPLVGVRELVHAAGLLGTRNPTDWVWTRVAGDAMDLTLLGRALSDRDGGRRLRTAAATAAVAGITAVDLYAATRARRTTRDDTAVHLHAAVTVNRPRDEVYRYWRVLENLPDFMIHLQSVRVIGDGRSHWTARAPVKKAVEWDAEIVEDRPGDVIAWRSLGGTGPANSGFVRFADAPGGRGTEVRVDLRYALPGGKVGAAVAKLLGEHPDQQVRDDLRRFKQVMETGEVVRSEGSPEGPLARRQVMQRPAQPIG